MARKKNIKNFCSSEPEFLISTMDRLEGWAVILCLVGGGQEINSGEAGIQEWFESLNRRFKHWRVYASKRIYDQEYTHKKIWHELVANLQINYCEGLHLSSSMRSFRNECVSDFIKAFLDCDMKEAKRQFQEISKNDTRYPIYMTHNFTTAKEWLKFHARGSERYGILASSNAARLKPYGIFYAKDRSSISPEHWFLNGKKDIRSSYSLEIVASEFETQGLELDYAVVAWDADLRYENGHWKHYSLSNRKDPPNWSPIMSKNNITYLINAYRVLLTRSRQGFIIFVPEGDLLDETRLPSFYQGVWQYFLDIGITVI